MHPSIKLNTTLLLVLILLSAIDTTAQKNKPETDSLKQVLSTTKSPAERLQLLNILGEKVKCSEQDLKYSYIEEARSLSKKWDDEVSLMVAEHNMGNYYRECKNDYSLAIEWYQNALSLGKQNNQAKQLYNTYSRIADCYEELGENTNVLLTYDKILQLELSSDDRIQTLGNRGRIYQLIGDYTSALENYNQSYNLLNKDINKSETTEDVNTLTLMGLKYQIAYIYMITSDYDRALISYKEIQALGKNIPRNAFTVLINMGIGDCYLAKDEVPLSIKHYNQAKKIVAAGKFLFSTKRLYRAQVFNKLSIAYHQLNKLDSSLYYATHMLMVAKGNRDAPPLHAQLPAAYTAMGYAYSSLKKNTLAIEYLNKAVQESRKTNSLADEQRALLELSNVYKRIGNTRAALNTYQQHIQIRDSVYNQTKLEELTRIDMQGDFDRQRFRDSMRVEEEKAVATYQLQKQRWLTYSGFAGVLLLLLFSFVIFRSFKHAKKANKIISQAKDTISIEKQVSEKLLKNILPEEVADELKVKGTIDAKLYDPVTVLFTDFVDFTLVGEKLSPQELVAELDECFKTFDEIIDKYDIEKIKTVGDAYIAVAGLPNANPNHGLDIVNAAVEIASFVTKRKEALGDHTFNIRIGVNTGSVVAGIVGKKKFAYDIWGDTVNIAARMEQNSEPGKVNISEHTHELVKGNFTCTYRGEIAAKNKGYLKMYYVEA